MSNYRSSRIACTPTAEGVRMKIGHASVCAVRNEQRDITVQVHREGHFLRRLFGRIPLVRGVVRMFSAFEDFFSAMSEAADLKPQSAIRGSSGVQTFASLFRTTPQSLAALLSGLLIPIILLGCLVGIPACVEWALMQFEGLPRFAMNAICCGFRIAAALLAIHLVCRLKVVNRLCMYRGACSKVLNAHHVHGENLTHEDALLSSRLTARSDGAFLIVVLIVSLIGFTLFRIDAVGMLLAYRIGVMLAAAAVTNEFIRPLERARAGSLGAKLRAPLVWLQHLFTIEPHNQMIEVAVCAYRAACENDIL